MLSDVPGAVPIDVVGLWSELKLEIVREYAQAYTTILTNQHNSPALMSMVSLGLGCTSTKPESGSRGVP